MSSERRRNPVGLAQSQIVGLSHVVEHEQFDHEMVNAVAPGFDHRKAVMTWIEVEKVSLERSKGVVAEPEAKDVLIEREYLVDSLDVHDDVAHPERARTKT